ncbi:histidine phosphatase family protein [Pontibacillus sp. ALD_SL1]|uniref:histidine phosphatase family protein n=1 Tax=Pontibacillus sp. ALD_SL1 TaxID=2777185 RepID=UPI001A96F834|nr:histidine phosphatase family protein [Pontibacillus sp. ALD_SL1]QSS98571.1 histidine phosphatase family protein [Pontibacillus sp. ALD_SL1]
MTTICLVRHGETDWNKESRLQGQEDIPLNNTGRQQAEEAGRHLQDSNWDVLITSPLSRAKETATIILDHLNHPIDLVEMDNFKERAFGEGSGLTFDEIHSRYPARDYPGQEDWEPFQKRIFDGLHEVQQQFQDKKILLVAHGAVINAILSVLSEGEIGSGKTKLMNACISNIEHLNEMWQITTYNETNHLS